VRSLVATDIVPAALFGLFGLWWILAPHSVLHFYGTLHRGKIRLPSPNGVRIAGGLWLALLVVVFLNVK
jgi:hypothetical protein